MIAVEETLAAQLGELADSDDMIILKVTDVASGREFLLSATGAAAGDLRERYPDAQVITARPGRRHAA
jgi:hypothetical protein